MQPRSVIFNEVVTKDLYTVRYSLISNKGLLFCGFKVSRASKPSSYLDRLWARSTFINIETCINNPIRYRFYLGFAHELFRLPQTSKHIFHGKDALQKLIYFTNHVTFIIN
jgi:hypothetical protein